MSRLMCASMLIVIVGGRAVAGQAASVVELTADAKTVVGGNNRFALELYEKLRTSEGNLFVSPYSISTALAMTYAGARGETAAEMAKVLHFNLPNDRLHRAMKELIGSLNEGGKKGEYQLAVANALWGRKGEEFRREYVDLVEGHYGGALRTLDFGGDAEAARLTINGWVEDKTQQKIKNLIRDKDMIRDAILVLTNAIYFKGYWAAQFKADQTRTEPFALLDGLKVDVPLMHQTGTFRYAEDDDCQLLELSYAGDNLAMTIVLPRKLDGLAVLEKHLDVETLAARVARLTSREVMVTLPKFRITSELMLNKDLQALGMQRAFRDGFTGMTLDSDQFIGLILHKAFVDVNEEGTEAAAATAVVMLRSSAAPQPKPVVFRADRPFLFLIRHIESGSILFVGRLLSPQP